MLDTKTFSESVEKHIREFVDRNIDTYIEKIISEIVVEPGWLDRVEQTINQNFARHVRETISLVNVNDLVSQHIDRGIERWQDRFKQDFATNGIKDQAETLELTVMPETVVVENNLVTRRLSVVENAEITGSLAVRDLVLKGTVNTDCASWGELTNVVAAKTLDIMTEDWKKTLVSEILDLARAQGIDFGSVTVNGQSLVDGDRLSDRITRSRISELGELKNLAVLGESHLSDTMHVGNRRVGINTQQPDMALSVWDEEVTVSIGKIGEKKAFIGTSRLQNLSIGVNRTGYLEISTDGMVTVKELRVGNHRIGHDKTVPGYSGTRGDIMFNSDPREGMPFAWVCLGDYRWQPLKSA